MEPFQFYFSDYLSAIREAKEKEVSHDYLRQIFVDLRVPETDGAELFSRIKTLKPTLPMAIITGYPNSDMMAQALVQGPFGVMNKLFSKSDIITAVNVFLRVTR